MPTWPGINPKFVGKTFSAADREVVNRFARYFYVTRAADDISIGNSTYRGFIMRPAEGISNILNVDREILVLLSDYATFEARTLEAFDEVYNEFDDVRIDRSIRFLVSRDPGITDKIRHYLQQSPEYPIVIPYLYEQFGGRTDNFILDSIRSNFLIRDLFGYQSPLRHEYFFFGRDKLLNHVIDLHKAGQNSSLFGLRKSGKTSTIYAIQRRARGIGCHAVLIDCQDPAVHARGYAELLRHILNEVRRSVNLKIVPMALGSTAYEISEQFRVLMGQTLANAKRDVLLIFDEIENISPRTAASPHWRSGHDTILFWQTLRSFFQNPGKRKLTFCFVGTNPHLFETAKINDVDNPVYLFAPKTFISPLSESDVQEMCERLGYFMGLNFDMAVIGYIHRRLGGHPFFVRQLCSQLHHQAPLTRPIDISISACKRAELEHASAVRSYVKEILLGLRAFYPEEYEMLGYLAHGNAQEFQSMASSYPELIEHLLGYGIIRLRGDAYEFLFDAVRDALVSEDAANKKISLEARRAEMNERRNKLEEEIRTALYHWSLSMNETEWAQTCDKHIPKQIERVGRLTRRQFFSRGQSPLYLLDLMAFADASGRFYPPESGSSVRSAFDTVNKLRIDAHAKSISEEEFARWQSAILTLEDVFLPPS